MKPQNVAILGATGSIGASALDVITRHPGRFRAYALTANRRVDVLAELCARHRPAWAGIADPRLAPELERRLREAGVAARVAAGEQGLAEIAARAEVDSVVAAIVGAAGLRATLAAAGAGKKLLLANKEALVCAGPLFMETVRRHGATLLPVDSEHNAVFQVFERERRHAIERIVLTASGGPFREREHADMEDVTPEQAVAHPNWRMGAKISVDSATMMNKGLEVIEAHHLFELPSERIDVVVHPQSVVHGMVCYSDGSVLAQLGSPDMRTPIASALGWPDRIAAPSPRLDLAALARLTFEAPDPGRFPALALARAALAAGGTAPTVLNAANEIAVAAFLARQIGFLDIARTVERVLDAFPSRALRDLEDVVAVDEETRARTRRAIGNRPPRGLAAQAG